MTSLFQRSARFCCPVCNSKPEIYAYSNYVRFYTKDNCAECGQYETHRFYLEPLFYAPRLGERQIIWGYLPEEIIACSNCTTLPQIFWTELNVVCPYCNTGLMKAMDQAPARAMDVGLNIQKATLLIAYSSFFDKLSSNEVQAAQQGSHNDPDNHPRSETFT